MTEEKKDQATDDQADTKNADAPKTASKNKTTPKKVKVLKIIAKRDGFRRAGIAFSDKEETVIKVADLKAAQVAMLKSEKMLMVSETTVAAE